MVTESGGSVEGGAPGRRDGSGRAGGLAGFAGAIVVAVGLALIDQLPTASAGAPQVYAFFLDETGGVARPSALIAVGLVGILVIFSTLRGLAAGRRDSGVSATTMLALAQVGIALEVAALVTVGVLTLRPEDADPGTSRALLDLSEALAAVGGAALAAAFVAAALTIRRAPGMLPPGFAPASLLSAAGCVLWVVRLFTDAAAFASDSFLGATLGWLLLVAWSLATGLWLAVTRPALPEPAAPPATGEIRRPAIHRPIPRPRIPRRARRTAKPPEIDLEEPQLKPTGRKPFVPPPSYPERKPKTEEAATEPEAAEQEAGPAPEANPIEAEADGDAGEPDQ